MRGIDKRFTDAMRSKLDSGRYKGRVGWDRHWKNTFFPSPPCGVKGILFSSLQDEIIELAFALKGNKKKDILEECADIANYAMMIADIHGALDKAKLEQE